MRRIVFIAGPDRSGKSTLCGQFNGERGWRYFHFEPPKGSPYGEYRDFLDRVLKKSGPDEKFVVDRYMYCEFAYSKHYGRKTDMTIEKMREIENEILGLDPDARLIYCAECLEINWDLVVKEDKREFRTIDELKALRDTYESVIAQSALKVMRYDFNRTTPVKTYEAVLRGEEG